MKKKLALLMIIGLITTSTQVYASTNQNNIDSESKVVIENGSEKYIPNWMKSNSIIVFDENENCKILKGGLLEQKEIKGREDIQKVGYVDYSDEMIVKPNIKVVYDNHGFIQDIYNLVPGSTDEYQLSVVKMSRVKSGVLAPGESTESYGEYYNYDTGKKQKNKITRSKDGKTITGTGRITYYTGAKGEAGTHTLVPYDCATKMYYDDVKGGTEITATNTYANKTQKYKKYDVGLLPKAILDIWSDSTHNPIKKITTSGKVDNVYSGKIKHSATMY